MRIAYIITGLSTGGAEIMLHKLLLHLDRRQIMPHVISLTDRGDLGARIEKMGIPVLALGMRRDLPNPFLLFRLVSYLRQLQPDIVSTWMYHADLLGGLAARMAGCQRVIWGLRNSDLSPDKSTPSTLLVRKVSAWLSPWVPTRILSCSTRARAVHAAIGYQASKIDVIPNGFDLTRFRPDAHARERLRAELGLAAGTPLVGLVARYDPQKNHVGFLAAASRVLLKRPNVHFVLAGNGVDFTNESLLRVIDSLGLGANVHLLGKRDDIPSLMAALDVLVCASTFGEAFPNVLGEGMACGIPCVVTDVGDCAEIVGNTGRVVRPEDMTNLARHIIDVVGMPKPLREQLGSQIRLRIQENFEIRAIAARYLAYYEQVMHEAEWRGNF